MQLSHYLDLFLTETQENFRRLDRGLLDLEETGELEGLEEAFRAVHTIKGMAASMGFQRAADLAHELEDWLDGIRQGRRRIDSELIDTLLATVDVLRGEIDHAVDSQRSAAGSTAETTAVDVTPAVARPVRGLEPPEGTRILVRVEFRADAALPGVRAAMALRNVEPVAQVLGSDPAEPGPEFDGELVIFLAGEPDLDDVEHAIRSAGEVERVLLETSQSEATGAAPERASPESVPKPRRSERATAAERRGRYLRVDLRHLDSIADGIAELAIVQRGVQLAAAAGAAGRLTELQDRATHLVNELQTDVLSLRMVPVGEVFDRFPRVVRDAARRLERQVEFRIEGRDIELDRAILDEIADPLVHLLRNAVGHGIEPPEERVAAGKPEKGRLTLSAEREQSRVLIRVEDDGRGVDRQRVLRRAAETGVLDPDADVPDEQGLLRLMTTPGFSTVDEVTDVAGRGVGLDVVADRVRALGGSLDLRSKPGEGSTFSIRLPLTLAVAQGLRVTVGGESYVIPLTHVAEAVDLIDGMTARMKGAEVLRLRDDVMPLLRMGGVLGLKGGKENAAVVIEVGDRRTGLGVDGLEGREQIVIKKFDTAKGTLPVFSGATLLADGTPALVLDPVSVTQGGIRNG